MTVPLYRYLLSNKLCVKEEYAMKQFQSKLFAAAGALVVLASSLAPAAFAQPYQGYGYGYGGGHRNWRDEYRYQGSQHPYVKDALIGGAGGGILGAVIGPEGDKGSSAVKGALLGAGAGLGYRYLKGQGALNRW